MPADATTRAALVHVTLLRKTQRDLTSQVLIDGAKITMRHYRSLDIRPTKEVWKAFWKLCQAIIFCGLRESKSNPGIGVG